MQGGPCIQAIVDLAETWLEKSPKVTLDCAKAYEEYYARESSSAENFGESLRFILPTVLGSAISK